MHTLRAFAPAARLSFLSRRGELRRKICLPLREPSGRLSASAAPRWAQATHRDRGPGAGDHEHTLIDGLTVIQKMSFAAGYQRVLFRSRFSRQAGSPMRSIAICFMVLLSAIGSQNASAQCVDCIFFDTCVPAGGNGWLRCRFQTGACIATGFCSGALRAARDQESRPIESGSRAFAKVAFLAPQDDSDMAASSVAWCPAGCSDLEGLTLALNSVGRSRLNAEAGTLIQLAQVNPIAAHVASVFARDDVDLADLTAGIIKLRAYTPAEIMQVVSGQPVTSEATESTPTISIAGKAISDNVFRLRIFEPKSVDLVLEYGRIGNTNNYTLVTWR